MNVNKKCAAPRRAAPLLAAPRLDALHCAVSRRLLSGAGRLVWSAGSKASTPASRTSTQTIRPSDGASPSLAPCRAVPCLASCLATAVLCLAAGTCR
jgi:hypothetical protein